MKEAKNALNDGKSLYMYIAVSTSIHTVHILYKFIQLHVRTL